MLTLCSKCANVNDCIYKRPTEELQIVIELYKNNNANLFGNIKCDYYIGVCKPVPEDYKEAD